AGPAEHGRQLGQGVEPDGVLQAGPAAVRMQQGVAGPVAAVPQIQGSLLEHDQAAGGADDLTVAPAADQGLAVGQLLQEAAAGGRPRRSTTALTSAAVRSSGSTGRKIRRESAAKKPSSQGRSPNRRPLVVALP